MFELDGRVYGKPHTPERAAERWRKMRGRTGILHSGHSVIRIDDGSLTRADATAEARVTFVSDITDDEIDAYVATGEPLEVAGAFTVDSLGGAFIERVEGDPSTVIGMSLVDDPAPRARTRRRWVGPVGPLLVAIRTRNAVHVVEVNQMARASCRIGSNPCP